MSQYGARDLLVVARSVLLDALDALSDQRDALILIGAQAIYIHTRAAPVALAEATKDSDIAIDRRALSDDPLLELALERAGFTPGEQPGSWRGRLGVPVDLMTPAGMADPGGTRGARMPPHSRHATRRTAGLEPAVVDYSRVEISALDESDARTFTVKVAGPAALIVAKMHKLGERQEQGPRRLLDKDAHDVYRLLQGVSTQSLVDALTRLRRDALAGSATEIGLRYFQSMFASGPDAIGCVMAGRAEELVGDPGLVSEATAALADDLIIGLHHEEGSM